MSNQVNHTPEREADVQKLCRTILQISPEYWDNPNGAYESTCPFCREQIKRGGCDEIWARMSEIKHKPHCAYLIAKDLSTNIS